MGRKEVQRCRWPVGAGSTLAGLRETWLRGGDLNPRPLGYEPNELPDCSTPRHYKRFILTRNAHEANYRWSCWQQRRQSRPTADTHCINFRHVDSDSASAG